MSFYFFIFQLNTSCIAMGMEGGYEAYKVCFDDFEEKEFTYTHCRSTCLTNNQSACTVR